MPWVNCADIVLGSDVVLDAMPWVNCADIVLGSDVVLDAMPWPQWLIYGLGLGTFGLRLEGPGLGLKGSGVGFEGSGLSLEGPWLGLGGSGLGLGLKNLASTTSLEVGGQNTAQYLHNDRGSIEHDMTHHITTCHSVDRRPVNNAVTLSTVHSENAHSDSVNSYAHDILSRNQCQNNLLPENHYLFLMHLTCSLSPNFSGINFR